MGEYQMRSFFHISLLLLILISSIYMGFSKSKPDSICSLEGKEMVIDKVKKLVLMGCNFSEEGKTRIEYNFGKHGRTANHAMSATPNGARDG